MSWFAWIVLLVLLVLLLALATWTFVRAPGREQDPGLGSGRGSPGAEQDRAPFQLRGK